ALADALAGKARTVWISGEAGVGKTRIAEEFAQRTNALHVDTLHGRAWSGTGAPSHWLFTQVFRDLRALDAEAYQAALAHSGGEAVAWLEEIDRTAAPLRRATDGFHLFDGV